jgi:hypothetical protein
MVLVRLQNNFKFANNKLFDVSFKCVEMLYLSKDPSQVFKSIEQYKLSSNTSIFYKTKN